MKTLSTYLSEISEFRRQNKNFAHPLHSILMLSVVAIFHGAEDFEEIADFGREKQAWLERFISFPNGIPSHDTIRRVFMRMDASVFNEKFSAWIADCLSELPQQYRHISIDGKTLRGAKSGIHLVSAVASELGVSLGQVKTDEKSNEITAIPELLDLLDINGCIVSIDAMGTQRNIASKIITKGGDYFLAVKGNQAQLYEQLQDAFVRQTPAQTFDIQDYTGSHNEVTTYKVSVCQDLKWVENAYLWPNLSTLIKVETHGERRGANVRYYISSLAQCTAQDAYEIARGHWSIENKLHWHLDVTLREDQKRNRKENSAQNMSLLRKILLNTAQMHEPKLSKKRIIKKMIWNEDYCLEMLAKIIS